MPSTISQLITLKTFGNIYLADNLRAFPTDFYPANNSFNYCKKVEFVDYKREGDHGRELPYADDPMLFFKRLKAEGCKTLRLGYDSASEKGFPARMLAGFVGGGGRWLIEAIHHKDSDFWQARWVVSDKNDPEKRIWQVTYGRIASGYPTNPTPPLELSVIKVQLSDALKAIRVFAQQKRLDDFTTVFESGLERLTSANPFHDFFYTDVAPIQTLPQEASQILAVALTTWVFGGMGSWNDLAFNGEDQATYEKVSEVYFRALTSAIVEAANTG